MRLAYDGTNYNGWQVQDNAVTVQQVVEDSLALQLGQEELQVTGCGRTDTGVHASDFYAHFDMDTGLDDRAMNQLRFKMNSHLPPDISIHEIFPVPGEMHARFSAVSRTYRYFIHQHKDPFIKDHSWYLYGDLDVARMNEGASILLRYNDFTSFARLHAQTKTNLCKLERAAWEQSGHRLVFTITADRFLRNMVRAIVGTLVELGRGKTGIDEFRQIIEGKDRSKAGVSAPAKGLFLAKVNYNFLESGT
jgi:tRNA pseudouridine38-40 synthase